MLSDKWRERVRKGGRILFYVCVVAYLWAVLDDLNSIHSDLSSLEANVSQIQGDVSSVQDDVSSIQSDVSSIEANTGDIEANTERYPERGMVSTRMSKVGARKSYHPLTRVLRFRLTPVKVEDDAKTNQR